MLKTKFIIVFLFIFIPVIMNGNNLTETINKDTVFIYDTVVVYDTIIVYDTVVVKPDLLDLIQLIEYPVLNIDAALKKS
jgi:hypothetical protein